jgi:hypothetical protein
MKITARQLRQIIKEELHRSMSEADETQAAATKIEPAPPSPPAEIKAEALPAELENGYITFSYRSSIPEKFYTYKGEGLLEFTVRSGKGFASGWKAAGKESPIALGTLSQQIENTMPKSNEASFTMNSSIGGPKSSFNTKIPEGKHYYSANASIYDKEITIRVVSAVQERRRRRI